MSACRFGEYRDNLRSSESVLPIVKEMRKMIEEQRRLT